MVRGFAILMGIALACAAITPAGGRRLATGASARRLLGEVSLPLVDTKSICTRL